MKEIDVAAILDHAPIDAFHRQVVLLGMLIMLLDGYDIAVMGFVVPAVAADWAEPVAVFGPALAASLMGVALGSALAFLPESPRFLVTAGRSRESVIALLQRLNSSVSPNDRRELVVHEEVVQGARVAELFRRGRGTTTTLLWVLFVGTQASVFFLASWLASLLTQAGFELKEALYSVSLFHFGALAGGLVVAWLSDRFGAERLLAATYSCAAAVLTLLGVLVTSHAAAPILSLLAGATVIGSSLCLGALAATYYPTEIRSTGVGWGLSVGRLGSIASPLLAGAALAASWSPTAILATAAAAPFICFASILALDRIRRERKRAQRTMTVEGPSETAEHSRPENTHSSELYYNSSDLPWERPMQKIDIFTHIWPKPWFERLQKVVPGFRDMGKRVTSVPMLMELDVRFRVMDRFADYVQILSMSSPPLEMMAPPDVAQSLAEHANDCMAELVDKYAERFPGFIAILALNNPEGMIKETRRAMEQLGAVGILLYTNAAGKALDAPEFRPLYAMMTQYDRPIWIHPTRPATFPDYQAESKSHYEMWWTLGWPYETTAAMARLVFSRLLDDFPTLKVITHHGGGIAPMIEGRLAAGWDQLGTRTSDADYSRLLGELKKRPVDYFRSFYADTAMMGSSNSTLCALNFFGADHMLFASDAPFDPEQGPMYIRETIRILDELEISEQDRRKIYRDNAVSLLGLKLAA